MGNEHHPVMPQVRLDELLAELQVRLNAVLATRDRVHVLLEAVVSVGSELDLETVLRRIVETATKLVDASYGALGVIGQENTLIQFIPVGLTEEEIARIEHWPHGLGLLGLLIKDARPLRLGRIADHPESYGFPHGHPPMGTFLGVPIRVREEVFGNLYLTEKRGGGEFDEEDEAIVVALATAAGVAVDNARLYDESRRRETWLRASSDVTTRLLSGADPRQALSLVADSALAMTDADLVEVLLPEPSRQSLIVEFAEGEGAQELLGAVFVVSETLAGDVFVQGEAMSDPDMQSGPRPGSPLRRLGYGPVMMVPFGGAPDVRGVLVLAKRSGRLPFSGADEQVLQSFAGQAAIALELAETRRDAERLGLLEDRDRIARDLHDVVIQRLFATAMTLMSTIRLVERPEAARRVQHAIDELDGTIRQIRSSIFALQGSGEKTGPSLRGQIVELVEGAAGQLGFMPGLRMEGQIDALVAEPVTDHLLAVLREALSNVVRHSRATRIDVLVEAVGGELVLEVTDNGVGLGETGRRSGLRNIEERATRLGGSAELTTPDGGGTRLCWRIPL
ncbi:signal transduction histidine kinase [Nonomuraea jabiensis]|uniref:Signal transduction histidine kinase n=2 Tax=Nonomuraea jabiensis TaxID=882448 RepID=A0A7W9GFU4_9ACTN|nr:GAF domain-containing protein [Nonomuraea jabiensis]MBB5782811.1 signal transduction histidine kinase [Nonomuraea jabiensis]